MVTAAAGILFFRFSFSPPQRDEFADRYDKARVIRLVADRDCTHAWCGGRFYLQSANFLLCILFLMGAQSAFLARLNMPFCLTTWPGTN